MVRWVCIIGESNVSVRSGTVKHARPKTPPTLVTKEMT